ncbi:MAG: sigma-54-dependent Fis family transcriptional regulator [Spirochaetales bacterium]|nr:sigma-54-dependent Fis family transcriptional regulator [Spirochaetales bacterium]
MSFTILIVDDEEEIGRSLSEIFSCEGYIPYFSTDPGEVPGLLANHEIDLILMDVKMPGTGGIDLLKQIKKMNRPVSVIMISGYPTVDNVVQAMKFGALNFYKKPVDISELLNEIKRLHSVSQARNKATGLHRIYTRNSQMEEILKVIERIAPTDAPVIITGESGTGKELVADTIHALSRRSGKPFIKINCAAIPDALLESDLFGYEQGAFTDAKKQKKGKFELAEGGSVFLDEITELTMKTQGKLLRVLQEKEFERLGGTGVLKANVRIMAATNKPVEDLVSRGTFRDDLFYRLSVIRIHLPPLRERKDDILLLASCFLDLYKESYEKVISGFSSDVNQVLIRHDWPGNIRELKNCVERAVIFCDGGEISMEHLPLQYRDAELGQEETLESAYDMISRQMILDALEKCDGIKQKAAEMLKIHRKTLYNKMKKLGIDG